MKINPAEIIFLLASHLWKQTYIFTSVLGLKKRKPREVIPVMLNSGSFHYIIYDRKIYFVLYSIMFFRITCLI